MSRNPPRKHQQEKKWKCKNPLGVWLFLHSHLKERFWVSETASRNFNSCKKTDLSASPEPECSKKKTASTRLVTKAIRAKTPCLKIQQRYQMTNLCQVGEKVHSDKQSSKTRKVQRCNKRRQPASQNSESRKIK